MVYLDVILPCVVYKVMVSNINMFTPFSGSGLLGYFYDALFFNLKLF